MVVPTAAVTEPVPGVRLQGFMAHVDDYPEPYLTAAAGLGVTR